VVLSAEHLLFLYLAKMRGHQKSVPEYAVERVAKRFLLASAGALVRSRKSKQHHCRLGEAQTALLLTVGAWRLDFALQLLERLLVAAHLPLPYLGANTQTRDSVPRVAADIKENKSATEPAEAGCASLHAQLAVKVMALRGKYI
jgi:hypothetical protein